MATFEEIDELARPTAAWFHTVTTELRYAAVCADPDRFQREYDEHSATWDRTLAMYDGSADLPPTAHDTFLKYIMMVIDYKPRAAALIAGARAAAREQGARLECRDISGVVDGVGDVYSDADPGL